MAGEPTTDTAAEREAPESRFAEAADDALTRAQRALGLIPGAGADLGIGRRIALAVAVAWLPLVVYALWERRLLPGSVPEPFLRHFGIHGRFLVALPLLLVAEATTRAALRLVLPQFVARGLLGPAAVPAFRAILDRASRLRRSRAVLAGMLVLVVGASIVAWSRSGDLHELAWATAPQAGFHFGVFWYSLVSRPIFLLVLLAWLWRLGVIGWAFARIARLDLRPIATHPDRAGGLGFLERCPSGWRRSSSPSPSRSPGAGATTRCTTAWTCARWQRRSPAWSSSTW